MGAKFAVEGVRQTVLEFVAVGAEQALERMAHDDEADAIVEKARQLFGSGPRVLLTR